MGRRWRLLWILMLLLVVTGCWDRVESEDRGFVIGIAVDAAEEQSEEQGKAPFRLTYQFVIPGALYQGGSGGSSGGGDASDSAVLNISSHGHTLFKTSRELATRTSRTPYIEHLKMIIVSEEVAARGQFGNVLDIYLRDHESRRGTKIMIAEGEAAKVLKVEPKNEKLPVIYIDSVAENGRKNSRILPVSRIGDVHEHILKCQSFTIPRITVGRDNKEVIISGAAVIHGYNNKMVGFLDEEETEGLNFITGNIGHGVLEVKLDDHWVVYEIKGVKRSIKAHVRDREHIEFNVSIESEGNVGEAYTPLNFEDPAVLSRVEQKVEEEIERLANNAISKLQKEYQTDVLKLGEYLRQEEPGIWKAIKDDWDSGVNVFAKSAIRVEAKVKVRSAGTVNRTQGGWIR